MPHRTRRDTSWPSTKNGTPIGIPFAKGHGTGNDFVILDDPGDALDLTTADTIQLCDRRKGYHMAASGTDFQPEACAHAVMAGVASLAVRPVKAKRVSVR
ncbi:hypothetical protein ACIPY6_43845 [Streptomyces sp. NPDC090054]|uniref:hypothetical protein n=1 Tax=Streptomyces sp. NPDC090054 TaxID=3365933 RepID=UPI00380732FD